MEYKISVFKDLLKSKEVPFNMTLDQVLERIRNGKSKQLIERIRNGEQIKNKLPCIMFSGEFSERSGNGLIQHSGLMVVDFDKYPSNEVMISHLDLLKQNKFFLSLFISPSGNGIKGVIKIPQCDKITHPKYFKEFNKEFQYEYFDEVTSNVDRVCFESYDPNIYINYDSELFNPIIVDEGFSVKEKVPLLPINDEAKIIDKIMDFNWKKGFNEGERNSFIFDLAGAFCEYGISQSTAEGYILNNITIGDFSDSEAKTTIKSAYKKRQFDCKFFEDYTKIDIIKRDLKKGKNEVMRLHSISEDTFEDISQDTKDADFWFIEVNDKTGKEKIHIDTFKYKTTLENWGFRKYFQNDCQKPTFVKVTENKVQETSIEKIKDYVLKYLENREDGRQIWNYCASYQNLFSENYLLMLDTIEMTMLKDNRYKSYLAFKNGILEITKDSLKLNDYIDDYGYIWESQIIQRNWVESKVIDNDYKRFISNITNGEPEAMECVIGYLLSTYKNKSNNKAIILNDEVISENPEGGTGKGVFIQGIKQLRKVAILDGKTFDDKKSFPYQTVSTETNVLVFDDVIKNFNFENKFSLVTEGMTLEKKNKDALKLSVEESPKMVISTNYAIKGDGNSNDRRRHEMEIAQYYGKNLTPFDEFKRELFDDWDTQDFIQFDNYMVSCLQTYLSLGLVQQNSKNIKLRKLIASTSMEFYEFIQEISENVRLNKQTTLDYFKREYPDYAQFKLTNKRFNIWVQKWCSYKGLEFNEGNTNGDKWFEINNKDKKEEDEFIF